MSFPDPADTSPQPGFPWVTTTVVLLLGSVFAVQNLVGGQDADDAFRLADDGMLRLGALHPVLVQVCGDWWRLFTAPLMHAGFLHIILNCGWLIFAGRFLERHAGGAIVAGILATGALTGSLLSLSTLGDGRFSVGASGAVVALGAAGAVLGYLGDRAEEISDGRKGRLAQLVVLALLPNQGGVDYAAHLGGALAGAVAGLVLLTGDAPDTMPPWLRRFSQGAAGLHAAVAIFAAVTIFRLPQPTAPAFDARFERALRAVGAGQPPDAAHAARDALRIALTAPPFLLSAASAPLLELLRGLARPGAAPARPPCADLPGALQPRLRQGALCG